MEISFVEMIGFGIIFVTQIGQTIKGLTESKVIKTELKNLSSKVEKQNSRVCKLEDHNQQHIEKFHASKK
jgi:hypothetical protein